MRRRLVLLIAVATLAAVVLFQKFGRDARALTDPVRIKVGALRGVWTDEADIALFAGIPYAAPATGGRRWRPPEPPQAWRGVRKAVAFGPECRQNRDAFGSVLRNLAEGLGHGWMKRQLILTVMRLWPTPRESEDCLTLNLRTAGLGGEARAPVMVWFHGGGFTNGSGGDPAFHANALVRKGVVLVTVNYRLGPFGYFAHPTLVAEGPRSGAGNYGLLDQIAALQWVRDNIVAFGGDPDNVTIFGESAGAMSVSFLMASPPARGLFHKAIMQSGVATGYTRGLERPGLTAISAAEAGAEFMAQLGETNALRAVPASDIVKCVGGCTDLAWRREIGPVVDGWALPKPLGAAVLADEIAPVPILAGYNADEGTLIYPLERSPSRWRAPAGEPSAIRALLREHYGDDAERPAELYRLDDPELAEIGATQMLGDDMFGVHHRFLAARHAARGLPAYLYFFARTPPSPAQTLGAHHAAEIPFVFGSHDGFFFVADGADLALTEAMLGYWTNFARSGDPNGPGLPAWPRYDPAADDWLVLDRAIRTERGVRREKLDILERALIRKLQSLPADYQ